MPARGCLAEDIFEVANLRSPAGLHIIQDMTELCERGREAGFRPGLEPNRCCCKSNNNTATDDFREQKPSLQERYPETYDWSHIYKCFQETQQQDRGFAELCFLCSDWFFDTESWELHCQDHVNDMENFPVFLDPLVFNGVLAMPGFCYNCLVDPRLPASKRMYQFKSKPKWQSHIRGHMMLWESGQ
ncbi:hypothetical protein EG328_005700 [Venturia inaequalis]|uniref:Uncharacterized protein n=1 Tax=Venturia inaequalis TaxID=5025 RepID=A0A8H3UMI1_VENIN|nr:hypothetical protein EG328_005700 [Venturia inaequalis]